MDGMHFLFFMVRYGPRNVAFRLANPGFAVPPYRLLHETYRLDLVAYARDGRATAVELWERCLPTLSVGPTDILEWGCGVARITRHLPALPGIRSVTGADVNEAMIRWNRGNIAGVDFRHLAQDPPMPFPDDRFGVVLAVSVLTHIPRDAQGAWLEEVRRILQPGGLLIVTTQGRAFLGKLLPVERRRLREEGILTRDYPVRGHRMMSAFHDPVHFGSMVEPGFETIDFRDGSLDPSAAGGQDLWLLRKRHMPKPGEPGSAMDRQGEGGTSSAQPAAAC